MVRREVKGTSKVLARLLLWGLPGTRTPSGSTTSVTTPNQAQTVLPSTDSPLLTPKVADPSVSRAIPSVRSASAVGETSAWYVETATAGLTSTLPQLGTQVLARVKAPAKMANQLKPTLASVSRPRPRMLLVALRLRRQELLH